MRRIDRLPTRRLVAHMNAEDRKVARAVAAHLDTLAALIDATAERLRRGGRLHYFGAGSSGRLAVLDAAECPPTFGVPPDLVRAHLAGGERALVDAVEGAEDEEAEAIELGPLDVAVGVSASGETPYVLSALRAARGRGALTAAVTCAPGSSLGALAEVAVEVATGPEVLEGSTRLKAGTAQKLVLNMLSTGVFTRLGHVREGRMLDVKPSNRKLRQRAIGIIRDATGAGEAVAAAALDAAGSPRGAIERLRRQALR
ncbi:MAG TPA: N-acetylmuramic acid 6-phosphate etherase [Candidatus Acidoferrales bacterium]|nr:N-acetylmuramic acid 6-phosphate etherase [Candidatus Acidoferrales bacterium]